MAAAYPIAEVFESIQGEGAWAGVPMTFIRLAGCNVGRGYTGAARATLGLEPYQERCTAWDGGSFACDTNYRRHYVRDVPGLVSMPEVARARRVCITGGEPLMHDLTELVYGLGESGKKVHVETSGTFDIPACLLTVNAWLAVSPKHGYLVAALRRANEIKVVVGADFNEDKFLKAFEEFLPGGRVWLQPVNDLNTLDSNSVERCLQLQQKHRGLRLVVQLHKILGLR